MRDVKRVCYLSSEFLTGRSLGLCLMNMDLHKAALALAADYGFDLGEILECEGDPGLGNGGLGRLAACFMDSLATLQLPAIGYGIRYDFGMFEQRIDGGRQVEQHDNWLHLGQRVGAAAPRGRADRALRRARRVPARSRRAHCARTGSTPTR